MNPLQKRKSKIIKRGKKISNKESGSALPASGHLEEASCLRSTVIKCTILYLAIKLNYPASAGFG